MTTHEMFFNDIERPTPLEVCRVLDILTNNGGTLAFLGDAGSTMINAAWDDGLRDDVISVRATVGSGNRICSIEAYNQPEITGVPGISWLSMLALDEQRLPVFARVAIAEGIDDLHAHNDMNLLDPVLMHWLSALEMSAAELV